MGPKHPGNISLGKAQLETITMSQKWFEGKTVAVVGNAQSLFNQKFGAQIDSHEVVVRINRAAPICFPTMWKNLNETTGVKTNVWVIARITNGGVSKYFLNLKHLYPKIIQTQQFQTQEERNQWANVVWEMGNNLPTLQQQLGMNGVSSGMTFLDSIKEFNCKAINVFGFDFKDSPTYYHQFRGAYGISDVERLKSFRPKQKDPVEAKHDYKKEREYCLDVLQPIYNMKFHF
jgi:hypothetical protein